MKRPSKWIDDPQLSLLLEASTPPEKSLWLLMADAGCRLREALSFNPSSLAQPGLHIWGSKTKAWRWCFVTDRLKSALEIAPPPPISARTAQRRLKRLCKAAGINILTPHHLRHSFATRLVLAGVPMAGVSELMGHSKESVTRIYVHVGLEAFGLFKGCLETKIEKGLLNSHGRR